MTRIQLDDLSRQLSAVTGQTFKLETPTFRDDEVLALWTNETLIGYALSLRRQRAGALASRHNPAEPFRPPQRTATQALVAYSLALGLQRGKAVETRFHQILSPLELDRLLADPRRIVRLWLGQESGGVL